MLLFDHYVAPSPIHGLGVFSSVFVPRGQLIWRFEPLIDREIPLSALPGLPECVVRRLERQAEYLPDSGVLRLGGDGDCYMNHSDTPNLAGAGDIGIAARDIHPGEEVTCDYRQCRTLAFVPDRPPDPAGASP